MLEAIAALADPSGFIELPDFTQTALYHPQHGYYRKRQQRIGRVRESDFFTASSFQEAFSEIVAEAAVDLLKKAGLQPDEAHWVEIGAEPGSSVLQPRHSPFRSASALRVGEELKLSGSCVVFSNELFDAQPFRQLRFDGTCWQEFGLRFAGESLAWAPRPQISDEARPFAERLPNTHPIGYTLDLPTGSLKLARSLLAQDWDGVFIAFDYGKTWENLAFETPQGTARAYRQHQQVSDVLETPGMQDITCHICWDHLEEALRAASFQELSLQSQEAFIVHRAPRFLQKVFDPSRSSLDPLRGKLKELMHPALMGQKFQALSAIRLKSSGHA